MNRHYQKTGKMLLPLLLAIGLIFHLTVTVVAKNDGMNDLVGSGNVRFAAIGDYGLAGQAEEDVANLVKSWNPDFIITLGDNNYNVGSAGTIDENIGQYYHEFIYPYTGSYGAGAATNRFFPSLGNHDWYTDGAAAYFNYFTLPGNEYYYDFVEGDAHFFVLDSDPNEPDGITGTSVQAAWLQNGLAASTSEWNIVYLHHAPYSSGPHDSNLTLQWPFAAWGADVVLAGHEHTYERLLVDGIPYFVNGLGGRSLYAFSTPVAESQVRYNADYGAMLVEYDALQITFQFITRTGVVIDTYSLYEPPVNDDYDSATTIPAFGSMPVLTTLGATVAGDDPVVSQCGIGQGVATVWYTYMPDVDSAISIDTKNADYDTFIAVWTGTRGDLQLVACNDDFDGTKQSMLAFQVESRIPYYIEVGQP